MGDVFTASGSQLFIGPAATSATDTAVEFAALTPWVQIGLVQTIGEFGDQSNDVSFSAIGDARVRHAKGAADAGSLAITCGADDSDAGQLAMIAAQATNLNYAFKVVYPNKLTTGGTNGIDYFRGLVMSKRKNVGSNDSVVTRTFNVGINSAIVEVPAT